MKTVTIPGEKPIEVTENDFLLALLDYLRTSFPKEECVLYEVIKNGKSTSEKPAAVLALLRNPQTINHYIKIVKREE